MKFDDESVGTHYNLPGGGVEENELLEDAVRREVLEETCLHIDVRRILFVFEYVPTEHRYKYGARHKVSVIFQCEPQEYSKTRLPDQPDKNQIGVDWVPLGELAQVPLLPQISKQITHALRDNGHYPIMLRESV